jgi:hypothetical protein
MLDAQNQGPQRTACDSPMKLTVIEPRRGARSCERLLAHNAKEFSGTSLKVL